MDIALNELTRGILAIVIAYLLGSIPSAYIVASKLIHRDIRRIGGGNVGGLNVFREVGWKSGTAVILADMAKGSAAVAIAYWPLGLPQPFVFGAGAAVLAGHLWMLFLKFSGGGGISTTIGVICTILPIYGYPVELSVFAILVILVLIITKNAATSFGVGIIFLPLIVWLGTQSLPVTMFSFLLGMVMLLKKIPTFKRDWQIAGGFKQAILHNSFRKKIQ